MKRVSRFPMTGFVVRILSIDGVDFIQIVCLSSRKWFGANQPNRIHQNERKHNQKFAG